MKITKTIIENLIKINIKYFFSILILLFLTSCNAQDKKQNLLKNKKTTEMTTETFDIETFNKNKNSLGEYLYKIDKVTLVKQQELTDSYWEFYQEEGSSFEKVYEYYKNGKLKSSFSSFPNDFTKGILKEYDEQGNLIKEEDLDKPYTYTWEDVQNYLKEHNVKDIQKQVIGISRWSDDQETTWALEFNGKYNETKGRFVIKLDGKTGEELEVKLFKGKDALGETGTIAVYDTIYKKDNKR